MPNLQHISLWDNPLGDATVLTGFNDLRSLSLDRTGISQLPPLPSTLESLWAQNNTISDVSGLVGLGALNDLNLVDNNISSLPDLSGLTSVTFFDIRNNSMTDLDLAALSVLPGGASIFSDLGRPAITGLTVSTNNVNVDVDTCFNVTVSGFDGGINYVSPVS